MAFVSVQNGLMFLHAPKTGGHWVRRILAKAGVTGQEYGEHHTHFPQLLEFASEHFYRNLHCLVFARHPLTWYQSMWAFRLKTGWSMRHPLDYNCASNDFKQFVRNCVKYKPSGWVSWQCRTYVDPRFVTDIGRFEFLEDDLVKFLTKAKVQFDPSIFRNTAAVNTSDLDGKKSHELAVYDYDTARLVIETEREVLTTLYAGIDHWQFVKLP